MIRRVRSNTTRVRPVYGVRKASSMGMMNRPLRKGTR